MLCVFSIMVLRGMHKHEKGIHGVRDIVEIIKSELRDTTKKFEFFIVEEFGSTAIPSDIKHGKYEQDEYLNEIHDSEDEGQTDVVSENEDNSIEYYEENYCISVGDIIWGKCGRIWYPARVCTLNDIPNNLRKKYRNTKSKILVKWYGKNTYSLLNPSQVDRLAQNKMDGCRALKSDRMQKL